MRDHSELRFAHLVFEDSLFSSSSDRLHDSQQLPLFHYHEVASLTLQIELTYYVSPLHFHCRLAQLYPRVILFVYLGLALWFQGGKLEA